METLRERPRDLALLAFHEAGLQHVDGRGEHGPESAADEEQPGREGPDAGVVGHHHDQQQHAADGQHEAGQDEPLLREPLGEAPGAQRGQQQANGFRGEDDPGPDRVLPATPPGGYAAATKDTPMAAAIAPSRRVLWRGRGR